MNNIVPTYDLPNINSAQAVLPAVHTRYSKEQLEEIIEKNYGIVTAICCQLDCTYKQYYLALKHYNISNEFINKCKKTLVGFAESAILQCLNSENEAVKLKAAEITLKSLGKNDGWSTSDCNINTQINISDKQAEIKQIFGI